jgi:DNA-binding response OmpR family regulator
MDSQARLAGKRILVVEDAYMLADDLQQLFEGQGASVAGPYASSAATMSALPDETFDCAVLDIALAGNAVYPLAKELRRRGAPVAFITGFSQSDIHPDFADVPTIEKPFADETVLKLIAAMLRK